MRNRRERGFTLIELLIVVAIIAILAAIAIMAYLSSIDRARQRRTVADIRTIAVAWESRASEMQSYGIAGYEFPATAVSYEDLHVALSPTYSRVLPQHDGWGRPFQFAVGSGPKNYAIRSAGRDGIMDSTEIVAGEVDNPDCDIIYGNGSFITYPVAVKSE
ncbi:MAG TPA: prepilin-type N-terminal cleavage/methylation domain-containing protein [Thermoanaerobaculia bacterium]|nr:prepilin-type N-terminal cleavage/methylation domain-containing protein [Thermoanaerobaculia bacterium]